MTSLPFELYKDHKYSKKSNWKKNGMKIDPDDFDYVYNEYIHATNCDLCNKLFLNTRDRQLDHNHKTGEVRNIVCQKCNHRKEDYKIINTTGERFISKCKDKKYKLGYCFRIRISRDGNFILTNARNTLEKAIICRDEFIKNHPEIYR
tara:strand:+ start:43 stop:486 length:444 start_codon:yes stop_codon:yes gene_type:complete